MRKWARQHHCVYLRKKQKQFYKIAVFYFRLIVSEKKTVTMHMRPPTMKAEAVAVEAAGQRYSKVDTFVYLGSTISSVGDVGAEIKRRTGYA